MLAALFAAIGAAGVGAALAAFEVLVPRRYILLCGLIYASSLGVWYFSSISESKILTASLATLYIAIYLRLRERWSWQGALWLTAVMGAACLNEIVSAFLIAIPFIDTVLRRGFDFRSVRWIAAHGLVIIAAYFFIEVTVNGFLPPPDPANLESGSSAKMFWFYAGISDHSLTSLYGFLLNWFFFTIAAPTSHAYAATPIWPTYFGYFDPSFLHYFDNFASTGMIALAAIMIFAPFAPMWRAEGRQLPLMLPLLAYSIVRGAFFFAFNPAEVMLFSSAIALPHLIMLIVPFAASRFPAKLPVLSCFAILLFADNLRFMIG
jgi:hypothetical protein